ncbi:hypothetical protein HYH03_017014 [Edaphochlamys debaryana]|uniref:SRCR domain-containing protein n=1 Tax=Edaphochlamys debaryana TaxID=47281 RepID=A0A835XJ66_9CHLO|nr:hypothetical protein HYH03_017014 [Edaphochlamys debaryana]|eukprot:KAG2484132.1 hypothetical protein HYH03_017014 [Edaphochlamys debaryana]
MAGTQHLEVAGSDTQPRRGPDLYYDLPGPLHVPPWRVANELRAAAICTHMRYRYGRYRRGSKRLARSAGQGLVWDLAPICYRGTGARALKLILAGTSLPGSQSLVARGACRGYDVQLSTLPDRSWDLTLECYNSEEELQPQPYVRQEGDPEEGALRIMSYNEASEVWRRVGGSPEGARGFLQIWSNGTWGGICSVGWDDTAADVACRQLGFFSGMAAPSIRFPIAKSNTDTRWRVVHMGGRAAEAKSTALVAPTAAPVVVAPAASPAAAPAASPAAASAAAPAAAPAACAPA